MIDLEGTLICQRCHGLGILESDEKVGNVLRILRREKSVQAKELAEEMLISPQYLTDLELGRRHWNAARVRSYLKALYVVSPPRAREGMPGDA